MKRTEIVFLLDRSGSMQGLEADTIGGFNSFIKQQKREKSQAFVTTVLFDDDYTMLHNSVDIKEIKKLTSKEYYARGMTALLDAIGKTINNLSEKLLKEEIQPNVIFIITTDGEENSSREFKLSQIKNMIENKKEWQFMFLGANIDAMETAEGFGINRKFASDYRPSKAGTDTLYNTMSKTVSNYRAVGEVQSDWNAELIEQEQDED